MTGKIIAKGDWKSIPIDLSVFEKSGKVDLIEFEELCDYNIKQDDKMGCKRKKKDSKKIKGTEVDDVLLENNVEKGNKEKKKKKKKNKKKKEREINFAAVNSRDFEECSEPPVTYIEDDDSELEFESEDEDREKIQNVFEIEEKTIQQMSKWNNLYVPMPIIKSLAEQKFFTPTPIQSLVLPAAIRGRRDIVGAAETGSGKTLAFGIPMLSGILDDKKYDKVIEDAAELDAAYDREKAESKKYANADSEEENNIEEPGKFVDELERDDKVSMKSKSKLRGLILTPTRELAVQIKNHLDAAAKYTGIKIAVVIGGLALPKQERVLKKQPDIVVATPGRLWELINDGNPHLSNLEDLRYLAIDETDRMLEKGHFQELENILSLVNADENKKARRQNFIFSATLAVVHDLPDRLKNKKSKKLTSDEKLNGIMGEIGVKSKAKVVDITNKSLTADTLFEAQIPCSVEEKDFYLYYILREHPGRTLVFCNSIDCVRRLASILDVLHCKPLPLHAQMHQKQRLKNLERFAADEKGLLVATDVAARGLDIPNVQHVIHYQVPRTSEAYVHRSGRTARASKQGISVVLIEPAEHQLYKKVCKTLNRSKDLPEFPVDGGILPEIKKIVKAARDYEKLLHQDRKRQSEKNWFNKMASEADLIIGDEHRQNPEVGMVDLSKVLKAKKIQLDTLIRQKLVPLGIAVILPASTQQNSPKIKEVDTKKGALRGIRQQSKKIQKKKNKRKPKKNSDNLEE
ncbi:ATP-dependent RNA helicase ddx24-like [Artemia franciscana]|uniref:ATP-dependent RNA helicase n=1 Tax=Artemia franciscana TaxID=6661 RepID=A0AA88IEN3_ARTSF|nr:hypothetical protein QYM36_001677 [Artemia franciscana]KAK2725302.1 hypothetical protein QYM36_001677 [Artemia franciscana]KAK2725303.1 hypothetical protein QYM36_001677 [Artemia franciscana]